MKRFMIFLVPFVIWQMLGSLTLRSAWLGDNAALLYFAMWLSFLIPMWRLYNWKSAP